MLFYIDHKCDTQPGFRKTFLLFTLIFVFFCGRRGALCSAQYSAFAQLLLCGLILLPTLSFKVLV
jgi:hypothetical protein